MYTRAIYAMKYFTCKCLRLFPLNYLTNTLMKALLIIQVRIIRKNRNEKDSFQLL